MTLNILLLITGFCVLILGANWVVNGASSLARRLKISELVIGLTIVAFGTSAPELVVNIVASGNGLSDIVMGNVVGSNIFNLLLILGIAGSIYPIIVQSQTVWREIPISFFVIVALLIISNYGFDNNVPEVSRTEGIILLLLFSGFMVYIFFNLRATVNNEQESVKIYNMPVSIMLIIAGLAGLIFGGRLVVNYSVKIAEHYLISNKLIGLTIVSIGTSLPELATSVIAAVKKKSDLAIGNVIGSNIFNIFLILGVSALYNPIQFNKSFNTDIFILGLSTLLLFIAMFTGIKKKLDRWEAIIMFLAFVTYMIYIVNRN
ncbi:MAG: calcium/sodium antiporter [Bacteroidales bacterium]|nr:calcium/sodium antiporter [Bacteroidales bacterium]